MKYQTLIIILSKIQLPNYLKEYYQDWILQTTENILTKIALKNKYTHIRI